MVGVMSGTSADAIDVAIVELGAADRPSLKHYREHPLPEVLREPILKLAEPGLDEIDALGQLDRALGEAIAKAVLSTIEDAGLKPADITAIGSHGQTVRHRPHAEHPFSLQIGCPSTIAEKTGITTVADFRRRDLAAGGEGAPLMPLVHKLLFARPQQCVAVVNIGGIANVTYLGADGRLVACDTGPGNMVMDGLMRSLSGGQTCFDRDGEIAAQGDVCRPLLVELLAHPFFRQAPPKSCGREQFGRTVIDKILAWPQLADAERLRTALELTVQTIAAARRWLPAPPQHWYVCGGGARNRLLMQRLAAELAPARVTTTDIAGVPAQALEAAGFALLGLHTLLGCANTLPAATGAAHPVCAGHIVPGANWPLLLREAAAWIR